MKKKTSAFSSESEARMKVHFTPEEDAKIVEGVRLYGSDFTTIALKLLPHRDKKACAERYKHHLDNKVNNDEFTEWELSRLPLLYEEFDGSWGKMAEALGTNERGQHRTYHKVKSQYLSYARALPFTAEEDQLIRNVYERNNRNSDSAEEVERLLRQTKTRKQVSARWMELLQQEQQQQQQRYASSSAASIPPALPVKKKSNSDSFRLSSSSLPPLPVQKNSGSFRMAPPPPPPIGDGNWASSNEQGVNVSPRTAYQSRAKKAPLPASSVFSLFSLGESLDSGDINTDERKHAIYSARVCVCVFNKTK